MRRELSWKRRGLHRLFFVLVMLPMLCVFPYIRAVNNPNEFVRVYTVIALVENHTFRIDEQVQRTQCENLAKVKAGRDQARVHEALSGVRDVARGGGNLMPPIIAAASAYATEQEICDVLRETLGTHSDPAEF